MGILLENANGGATDSVLQILTLFQTDMPFSPAGSDHPEIFSCPQVIENSRQHLVLRKDILQETIVGCP